MSRNEEVLSMRAQVRAAMEALNEVADKLDRMVRRRKTDAEPVVDAFDDLGSALLRLKSVEKALVRIHDSGKY